MPGDLIFTAKLNGDCLLCGCTPMSEGPVPEVLPMAHARGMDVNWGEDVNICQSCIGVMADFCGRVSVEKHERVCSELAEVRREFELLSTRYEATRARVSRIVDGERAKREKVA